MPNVTHRLQHKQPNSSWVFQTDDHDKYFYEFVLNTSTDFAFVKKAIMMNRYGCDYDGALILPVLSL